MEDLIKSKVFTDNGSRKREKENFQGYLFSQLDLSQSQSPISFYRSDFRGVNMRNCQYYQNNFGNADFIDCVVKESKFKECEFKYSEVYNSYFDAATFDGSSFSSASLVKAQFHKGKLFESKFRICTFRDCQFSGTEISDCEFSKCSLDEVHFNKVTFNNVDMSGSTAINLYFTECTFENLVLDADYLGSYFFKKNIPKNIKLKYRGQVFPFDMSHSDLLSNLFRIFWEAERYYEAINIFIQKNLLEGKTSSIFQLFNKAFTKLKKYNSLKSNYQFDKFFSLFEYYFNTGYVPTSDYFKFIEVMESYSYNLKVGDFIGFSEKIFRIKSIVEEMPLEAPFIGGDSFYQPTLLEIVIDEVHRRSFEEKFGALMKKVSKKIDVKDDIFFYASVRKGSVIFDVVTYAGIVYLLLKASKLMLRELRAISNESMQFKIDYQCNKSILKQLNSPGSLDKVKKIRQMQILTEKVMTPTDVVSKSDVKKILPLINKMVWHPNDLTNS